MKTLSNNNSQPFFTQEKDKYGKWLFVSESHPPKETPKEAPKETPKEAPKETPKEKPSNSQSSNQQYDVQNQTILKIQTMDRMIKSLQDTVRRQSNIIVKQNLSISTLQKMNSMTPNNNGYDAYKHKLLNDTKQALLSAQSNGSVKQLKFQLHPDKHPSQLRWLFEDLFKLVNV